MKNLLKTLFASAIAVVFLSSLAFTSAAADHNVNQSVVPAKIDFNKVVITGNARVVLIQSKRPRVLIYESYNKETTSVVQRGDKLCISSDEQEPINIIVYVKDLQRIDASNMVSVTTKGNFSSDLLQVFLKDNANAGLNGTIGSLYTVIKDHAGLKLRGSSNDHVLVKSKNAKLKMDQFVALKTTISPEVQPVPENIETVVLKDSVIAAYKLK